jgi:hypothetical protein
MVAKLSGMRLRLGLRPGLARGGDVDRHQERQRRDVVHEGRENPRDRAHDRDMRPERARGVHQRARDQQHRARAHQPRRDHEDERHHDDGRMAEAGEGGLGGHEAEHNGQQERAEGDHVVAEPSPEQEREDAPEEREEKDLVLRHRRDPNPPAGFAKAVSGGGPGDRRGAKNPCFRAGKRAFSAPSHRSRTAQPVAAPGGLM